MQALYQWDLREHDADHIDDMIRFVREELAPEFDDQGYVAVTTRGVLDTVQAIDETLAKYAPDWPVSSMAVVDRNILRIGVYELEHNDAIPSKVAINEAIEIAKAFGGETSGKFVNGVLGAVYKDRLESGAEKEADDNE